MTSRELPCKVPNKAPLPSKTIKTKRESSASNACNALRQKKKKQKERETLFLS